jgi:hypothetical protein
MLAPLDNCVAFVNCATASSYRLSPHQRTAQEIMGWSELRIELNDSFTLLYGSVVLARMGVHESRERSNNQKKRIEISSPLNLQMVESPISQVGRTPVGTVPLLDTSMPATSPPDRKWVNTDFSECWFH